MKNILLRGKNLFGKPIHWFRSLSRKKKLLVIVIAVIVFFVVVGIFNGNGKPKYTTVAAIRDDITEVVTETGSIQVVGRTDIFSPASGIVESVFIKNGDNVSEGQTLFTVNASATEQEEQAAYANYLTAQTTLNAANSDALSLRSVMFAAWDDYYNLATGDHYENSDGTPRNDQRGLPEFHIAKDDWLAAEKKYKDQQTVVAKAQASVSSAWLLYQATQDAEVKATAPGTIANLAVTTGSSVVPRSATVTLPVVTITTSGITELVVPISETDIAKIQEGQEAIIDISAIDGKAYQGVVRRVDTIGTELAGVNRYNAYIEIADADDQVRSGMSVDAEIITQEVTDVLTVPNAAVKPYQGGRAVRVVGEKGEIVYIPVEIGVKGTEKTQIISGIDEGTQVITALSNDQLKRGGFFGN